MANEAHVPGEIAAKCAPHSVDDAIADVAGRQHGVLSRAQLLDIGLGPERSSTASRWVAFTGCTAACMPLGTAL